VDLTREQERAVRSSVHSLVSAGPGSGKTRVLSMRAAHILSSNDNHRVVAVTFTKDAARELEERITGMAENTKGRLVVGTFHGLCLRQIKRIMLRRKRLIGAGEQRSIIRRAILAADVPEMPLDDAMEIIDAYKATFNPRIRNDESGDLYRSYQEILARENLVDFADLIILAVMGMDDGSVGPYPATHMLVDESQDIDEVQYAWVKRHAGAGVITTLVGDDDQSIYGWRHALGYDGLMRFKAEHRAEHVTLAHNFRSDRAIIRHASKLIRHNRQRVEKNIICASKDEGIVETVTHVNESEQALAITRLASDGQNWAVLGRTNKILDLVELALMAAGIPYQRMGGSSLWDRDVPAIYLAFLESIMDDHCSGIGTVLHWAGVPNDVLMKLDASSPLADGLSAIGNVCRQKGLKPAAGFIARVVRMIPQWRDLLTNDRVNLVCGGVASFIEDYVDAPRRVLLERASFVLGRLSGTLPQRIAFVRRKNKNKDQDREDAQVTLCTMHASKGLEFDCVSVASCVEGTTPHIDSPLDEERRLMYVAMTRARHRLVLHSYLVDADGETSMTASRFIAEAGL